MKTGTSNNGEKGIALVAALWAITTLALLAASLDLSVKNDAALVRNNLRALQQQARIDAGFEIAAARLRDTNVSTRWSADGASHRVVFDGAALQIRIEDANARLDLNVSDLTIIEKLVAQFASSDAARVFSEAIGKRRKAAERTQTVAFVDPAQLLDIEGVSYELYRRLAPFVTVHSRTGRINPVSAQREVLASLPKLTAQNVETALTLQATASRGNTPVLAALRNARRWLTPESGPAFIVTVDVLPGRAGGGRTSQGVLLIDVSSDTPYHLLAWRADTQS
ncbi:MAG: hypothetical protein ACR2O4_12225 [Hyphomicrobiaceae bacterium]